MILSMKNINKNYINIFRTKMRCYSGIFYPKTDSIDDIPSLADIEECTHHCFTTIDNQVNRRKYYWCPKIRYNFKFSNITKVILDFFLLLSF